MNPNFLSKLGTDESTRKQFEEDVKFLNDFSKNFRKQQLAQGREIINQGWFCDENGNWGGWCVSRPTNQTKNRFVNICRALCRNTRRVYMLF